MLDELELQCCVDGELSESKHREFLQTVEKTPGGWRTLALAFTEEQIWGAAVTPASVDVSAHPVANTTPTVPQKDSHLRVSLTTMALSLLVALTTGLIGGDMWRESRMPKVASRSVDLPGSVPENRLPSTVQSNAATGLSLIHI